MSKDHFDDEKLQKGIEYSLLQEALEDLQSVDKSMDEPLAGESKSNRFWSNPLKLAAVLVPLIIISSLGLFQTLNKPEFHAVPYFEPFDNDFVVKTRSIETVRNLEYKAFGAYDKGEYDLAEGLFEKLIKSGYENKSLAQLFLANSLLAQGRSKEASALLDQLLLDPNAFIHETQWYLAIAVLDQGDSLKTQRLLQTVAQENDLFSEIAQTLLDSF